MLEPSHLSISLFCTQTCSIGLVYLNQQKNYLPHSTYSVILEAYNTGSDIFHMDILHCCTTSFPHYFLCQRINFYHHFCLLGKNVLACMPFVKLRVRWRTVARRLDFCSVADNMSLKKNPNQPWTEASNFLTKLSNSV